jgi:hypothetical protein
MKFTTPVFLIGMLFGCNQPGAATRQETKTENSAIKTYKPGLGEIMGNIQTHHAKLWFAGIHANWKLSDYEIHEIKEMFQTARDLQNERPEVQGISMIDPELDRVSEAIKTQNIIEFRTHYQSLTNTCNACHKKYDFEFNVITIPTAPPVTNQDFEPK